MNRYIIAVESYPSARSGIRWYWEVTTDERIPVTLGAGRAATVDEALEEASTTIDWAENDRPHLDS